MGKLKTGWVATPMNARVFRWHYVIKRDKVETSLCGRYSAEPEKELLDAHEHEYACSECLHILAQNLCALHQLALSQETSPNS